MTTAENIAELVALRRAALRTVEELKARQDVLTRECDHFTQLLRDDYGVSPEGASAMLERMEAHVQELVAEAKDESERN